MESESEHESGSEEEEGEDEESGGEDAAGEEESMRECDRGVTLRLCYRRVIPASSAGIDRGGACCAAATPTGPCWRYPLHLP